MRKLLEFPAQVQTRPQVIQRIALLHGHVAGAAFARRCQEAGIEVFVLKLVTQSPQLSARHPHAEATMDWSLLGTPEGLQRIQDFVRETKVQALATVDEFALLWLAQNRHLFEPECRLLAPDAEVIASLQHKDEQCEIGHRSGLHILRTWEITTRDIAHIPVSAYPICLRPSTFSSVTPMFKAETFHTAADLKAYLNTIEWTKPLLAQPFVSGPNIIVHASRNVDGYWQEMRAYRAPVKAEGFAVVLEETPLPLELERACKRFAEISGAVGCFHFDLLQSETDGTIYFLEINLRLGGSTAKVMMLGLDEPIHLLLAYGFEPPLELAPLPRHKAAGSMRLLLSHCLNVLRNRAADIAYPRLRTPQTMLTLLRYGMLARDPSIPVLNISAIIEWSGLNQVWLPQVATGENAA